MQSLSQLNRPVPLWLLLLPLSALVLMGWQIVDFGVPAIDPGLARVPSALPWTTMGFGLMAFAGIAAGAYAVNRFANVASPAPSAKPLSQAAVARSGTLLDLEAARAVGLMTTSIGQHVSFAQSLGTVQDKIAGIETQAQLRVVAGDLVDENQRMRRDTELLAAELQRSRSQIQELRDSLQSAQAEGLRDALTSIGNRRAFEVCLTKEMATAAAAGTPLSIIMADIDMFKKVNDSFGHPIGDEVLKIFARLLSNSARDLDMVTRYGGEEFAVIMPKTVSMGASIVAERMRSRIESDQLKLRSGELLKLTASFGVAQLRFGETAETLVARADARLYKAKSQGRNRVITS